MSVVLGKNWSETMGRQDPDISRHSTIGPAQQCGSPRGRIKGDDAFEAILDPDSRNSGQGWSR